MKKRYDSYKPSGIDWIGDIPSHWNIVRLAHIFNAKAGGDAKPELYSDTKDAQHPFPVYTNSLSEKQVYAYTSSSTFQSGSITVTGRGEIGHAFLRDTDFDAIIRLLVLTPRIGLCCKYFTYFIDGVMEFFSDSAAVSQLSAQQINKELVILPPLSEQQAIADYLDAKCAEIDAAIAKVDREIELIDELKQSEISRVVTRGLNPDTPLRPSGIDWIGDIPEHWEICRIKHKADVVLGKMLLNEPPKEQRNIYSKEKYLKSRNIGWLNLLLDEVDEMWFNESEKSLYKLNDGDVLVNEGGDIGKVAIWHNQEDSFYIQNSVHKISPIGVTSGFLVYWIFSLSKRDYFWSIVSQVSIAHLTKEKLSNTPLIVPPLSEQQAIADYLDKKCAEIDGLKAKLNRKRETLTELRQSIISEVVTGKRKVI